MTDLSPAAQAVMDAFLDCPVDAGNYYATRGKQIAAALRAAADQVVPDEPRAPRKGMRPGGTGALSSDEGKEDQRATTRHKLLAIAAELEALDD